jgi:hypothetical protein
MIPSQIKDKKVMDKKLEQLKGVLEGKCLKKAMCHRVISMYLGLVRYQYSRLLEAAEISTEAFENLAHSLDVALDSRSLDLRDLENLEDLMEVTEGSKKKNKSNEKSFHQIKKKFRRNKGDKLRDRDLEFGLVAYADFAGHYRKLNTCKRRGLGRRRNAPCTLDCLRRYVQRLIYLGVHS